MTSGDQRVLSGDQVILGDQAISRDQVVLTKLVVSQMATGDQHHKKILQ